MKPSHLYVHVPFCARRCTYCDFAIAVRRQIPADSYLKCLRRELTRLGPLDGLLTVYLGGGTPSLLGGEGVEALALLLEAPRDLAEFTLEANPDDVTPDAARAWARAGINRVSLGAQSFDDRVLAWMHRTHDSGAIGRAMGFLREAGIVNVSLDLIFALPPSLERDLDGDLVQALALSPTHVSLYGLTIEPGTPLARQVERAELEAAPEGNYEREYLLAHRRLSEAGLGFYEVSNAALRGYEAVHNRAYWRLTPYLGIGPSAHSYDGATRWWNEPAYSRWAALLEGGKSPVAGREILGDSQRRLEEVYLALRTREGLRIPEPCPEGLAAASRRWVESGWAVIEGERLCLTPQGWLRLDVLVASL